MFKRHLAKTRGDKNGGFTLIELLMVVGIIAILSSIVMGTLEGARAKSRNAKRVSVVKQYQNALELYRTEKGAYPITPNGERKCLGLGDSETCIALRSYHGSNALKTALEPYIPGVPALKEPVFFNGLDMSGLTYRCLSPVSCSSYELYWVGEGTAPFCGGGKLGTQYGVAARECTLTF